MQAGPDYYGVLGVKREATAEEIKAAFLKLATEFHAAGKPKSIDDLTRRDEQLTQEVADLTTQIHDLLTKQHER